MNVLDSGIAGAVLDGGCLLSYVLSLNSSL